MKYNEDDIKRIMVSIMKEDDTFSFGCEMCGNCCRNRDEPIMLAGYDVFRVSKTLGIETHKFFEKYTEWYIGENSNLPIIILKERYDGSCSLLRKGKCMVHDNKPIVCAIYPLGRMFVAGKEESFGYFKQDNFCENRKDTKHTLEEWLNQFNIRDWDEASILWSKTIMRSTMAVKDLEKDSNLFKGLVAVMLNVFYIAYDIDRDYLPQFKENIEKMEGLFEKLKIKL